jgi:hypothetical protein
VDYIARMSVKLIEPARKEIGHDLASQAVRIELSSIDRMSMMTDESRDITLDACPRCSSTSRPPPRSSADF